MKKFLLPLLLIFFLQAGCKDSDSSEPEPEPKKEVEPPGPGVIYSASLEQPENILLGASGYNPRNFIYDNPWTNLALDQKFQLGLVNSEANMIRYPGGTFGNFWNNQKDRLFSNNTIKDPDGWVDVAKIENEPTLKQIQGNKRNINSVDDLKFAAKGGTSGKPVKVVFQMNMVTPGQDFYAWKWGRAVDGTVGSADWYAMLDDRYNRFKSMLLRAKSGPDPIELRFIELGNEYYFPHAYCEEAFPTGADHGTACNYIADKLKKDPDLNLPDNVRIAATASSVTGPDARRKTWNSGLASTLNKNLVGYVTMHVYKAFEEPSVYSETNFQKGLVDWYEFVDKKFTDSGADASFLMSPANWRVWYTETNANWDPNVDEITSSSDARWAQVLVDAYSVLHLYDRGNAAMVLQFQFNNQVAPGTNGELYNRAHALKPYMKASREATSAARISFEGTTMAKLPNSPKSVVQGYCFISADGVKKCVLINLSATEKHINLGTSALTGSASSVNLEGYNNPVINGKGAPNHYNVTFPSSDVILKPYSVNYIYR